jgi:hypothetical protein
MELVRLSSAAAGATFSPVGPVWVFLGTGPLATKTLVYEGWKSLDFLGFSRPDQALSKSYAGFSLDEISRALCPHAGTREIRNSRFWAAERDELVIRKLTSISAFLQ